MKRVLLTGISGVGKSTVTEALATLGYKAIDADSNEWSEWVEVESANDAYGSPVAPNRDWVWREEPIARLLATEDAEVLFVSGCAENMVPFLPRFDHIILLSTPPSVIVERLATRTTNTYGKQPDEVARILSQKETVEPLLPSAAGYEIETDMPLAQVVVTVLDIVE